MSEGWWVYERCKSCIQSECPRPSLNTNHVDGPYIGWCNGQMRWLTFRERVAMFFGKLDIRKLRP